MQIDHFLSIIAAITTFFGTIFLLGAVFRLTPRVIARLSAMPYGGFSPEQLETLSKEKADICSGVILIVFAFVLEMLSLVLPPDQRQILDGNYKIALYVTVSLSIMMVLFVYGLNVSLRSYNEERAKRAVVRSRLERALQQNPIERAYWTITIEGAEAILGIERGVNETVREFLQRLARELQVPFPRDVRIEGE